MWIIVVEGLRDVTFISEIIKRNSSERVPAIYSRTPKESIRKLIRLLRTSSDYHYYQKQFGFIVYGDNGRPNVINKVLPRLCNDLLGKDPPKHIKLFTILDDDGISHEEIMEAIKEKVRSIPHSRFVVMGKVDFGILDSADDTYRIDVSVFFIPLSLERQIQKKGREITGCKDGDLGSLAELKKCGTVDELIRKVVDEGWFDNEKWYRELVDFIKKITS